MDFVILTHPIEVKRRRITTGRMAFLSLQNSHIIMGHDYSDDPKVNQLLNEAQRHCVLLYPDARSLNLSFIDSAARQLCPPNKRLTVFVVDGTWATARKTVRLSENLNRLPRICFSPERPSGFRVRQQPRHECHSTIEAIHQTIELLGPSRGFDIHSRLHDRLLTVFEKMVNRQIELAHMKAP